MLNATKACIMITLFFSTSQGKNHVCYSSIDTFLQNLSKHHQIDVKRRWIFYCFRWLLDEGYITRKSRHTHDGNGLITQIPSMISFTLKGAKWLFAQGVSGAAKIVKSIVEWWKKKDGRFPAREDFSAGIGQPEEADQRKELKDLLEIVTKKAG